MNVKDGETILYHPNGEVSVKQYYKKGTLHGIKELYSASGKLLRRDEYVNGVVKQMNE
jgi:antitoxin component YwqK of YwqJK toxin-antitoxin module